MPFVLTDVSSPTAPPATPLGVGYSLRLQRRSPASDCDYYKAIQQLQQTTHGMITEFAELVGLPCHFRQEKGHREALGHRKSFKIPLLNTRARDTLASMTPENTPNIPPIASRPQIS